MRAAFKKDGAVTAGNASGINDGAGAVVLASAEAVKAGNLKPIARLVSYAHAGVEPTIMGIGPVPATKLALAKAGLKVSDLDVIESNEAFAAQACAVVKELGLDPPRSTRTARASRWATRSAPPARSSPPRRCTSCSASAGVMRW